MSTRVKARKDRILRMIVISTAMLFTVAFLAGLGQALGSEVPVELPEPEENELKEPVKKETTEEAENSSRGKDIKSAYRFYAGQGGCRL